MPSSFDTAAARLALAMGVCATTFAACAAQPSAARSSAYSSRDAQLFGSPQWQSNYDDRPASLDDVTAIDVAAFDAGDERDAIAIDDVVIDTPSAPDSNARIGSSRAPNSAGNRGTPPHSQGSTRRYNRE